MNVDTGSLTPKEYHEICNALKVYVNIIHQEGEPVYMTDIRDAEVAHLRVIIKKMEDRMIEFPSDFIA